MKDLQTINLECKIADAIRACNFDVDYVDLMITRHDRVERPIGFSVRIRERCRCTPNKGYEYTSWWSTGNHEEDIVEEVSRIFNIHRKEDEDSAKLLQEHNRT